VGADLVWILAHLRVIEMKSRSDGDEKKSGQHRRQLQRTKQKRSVGFTDDDESPFDYGDDPLNRYLYDQHLKKMKMKFL